MKDSSIIWFTRGVALCWTLLLMISGAGAWTPLEAQQFGGALAMGGTGSDQPRNMAVDTNGNIYTVGRFRNTADFDPGPAVFNLTSAGGNDIFISKLDSSGNFIWARAMAGPGFDQIWDVAPDEDGNVYVAGSFTNTVDFDPGPGVFNLTVTGNQDVFVAKLDSAGDLIWAGVLGGSGAEQPRGMALDADGNVYTVGRLQSAVADFDPGSGVFNLISAGGNDIFISKLDSDGDFLWAVVLGDTGQDQASGIAVDGNGDIYTTGSFSGIVDFDPGPGASVLTSTGANDVFVSKLDSAGNFLGAVRMGGSGADIGFDIEVDAGGNVITVGGFRDTADFDPGPGIFNLISAGNQDIFISRLDSDGSFLGAVSIGGPGGDNARRATLDTDANIYVAGQFSGTVDFDPGLATASLTSAGGTDAFVLKTDAAGNFVWVGAMGGPNSETPVGLELDGSRNLYTAGQFDVFVTTILQDSDADGVLDGEDLCPATMTPESIPNLRLGTNRWALVDGDSTFDTEAPRGRGPDRSYNTTDTGGCSCGQILEKLTLGKGQLRFGCSTGIMDTWVKGVSQQ